MAALMTFYPVLSFAQSVPAGVTNIIPDGRTATTVTSNGSVSTVTTNTISGPNAFNSYSKFQIGAGNTGNLVLPNGTSNLINLVNGSTPTTINGTLNAYKNGQIGGNVYFADPNGFIVGKSGVVNVGSLSVTTPTREFMDSVIGTGGQINQGAVNNILAGTVPLSPDGNIRIRGRINAVDAVRLTGQNVAIGSRDASRNQALRFGSTVNSKGLRSADKIVVRNGSIQIVAANNVKINGGVKARRGGTVSVRAGKDVSIGAKGKIAVDNKNGAAGSIAVNAGRDITIAGYGTLSAKSEQGDGGNIVILAQRNLTVSDNVSIDVSSAQSNAGFVDLSARGTASIGGIKINLSATNGVAGTLLIDPYDLTIGNAPPVHGDTDDYSVSTIATNILSFGGNVILSADNSITIASGFYIDTRDVVGALSLTNPSRGNSGNVTLNAPTITINGAIYTNVINAGTTHYNAGNVTLNATVSKDNGSSSHTATSKIDINGTIDASVGGNSTDTSAVAGNVALLATATSTAQMGEMIANTDINIAGTIKGKDITAIATSTATSSYSADVGSTLALIAESLAAAFLGINGGYVAGTTHAHVNVLSGADIQATGKVQISAVGQETAALPSMVLGNFLGSPFTGIAVVGGIDADIATNIALGASIQSHDQLAVTSTNNATLSVSALAASANGVVSTVAAISKVRVNTSANIEYGASLTPDSLLLVASNTNSFSTSATSAGLGSGAVGAAVAYADIGTDATANLAASLTFATGKTGNVSVEALSNTTKMVTSASVITGTAAELLTNNLSSSALAANPDPSKLELLAAQLTTPKFGTLGFKASGALAYTSSNQSAEATITNGGGATTPTTITTPGDVAVVARTVDSAIRSNADSGASANSNDGSVALVLSVGIAYGDYTHSSSATIGSGAIVTAANVGVYAKTDLPNENTWVQTWKDIQTPSDIFSHLNGNLGTVNNILTSYANSVADGSSNLALAGSVNYFSAVNNTTAWISTDAHVTSTSTSTTNACLNSSWCTTLYDNSTVDWGARLQVMALAQIQTIDVAGNFSVFSATGTSSGGSSVGGALNLVWHENNTVAGIGKGAAVSSNTDVSVFAQNHDLFFALAPSSGLAVGPVALNGIVSYAAISDNTTASISNLARISAPAVNVQANDSMSLITASGALTSGGTAGVGLSNAVLVVGGSTNAYIGDNTADNSDDTATTAVTSGHVYADALNVKALTTGRVTSASVAAAESDPATAARTFQDKMARAVSQLQADITVSLLGANGTISTAQAAVSDAQSAASKSPPSFSIDIAGSTSFTIMSVATNAKISGATIDRYTTPATGQGSVAVAVQALNDAIIGAGSGAASLNFGGAPSGTSVAVAGALAYGVLTNATTASIDSSTTISHAGNVTVRALSGGEETIVGLAIAASASGGSSLSFSLSGSVGIIKDSVLATISNSTINGSTDNVSRDITVQSYQEADIGIGAGALYASATGGIGASVSYANIGDPSTTRASAGASIYSTAITQMQDITVTAQDAARIAAGAITGGGGPGATGFAGAIVIAKITNSVSASIGGDASSLDTISVSGAVVVSADSSRNATLSNLLAEGLSLANPGAGPVAEQFDYSGAGVNGGNSLSNSGAIITAIAGAVQAGQSNVGVSLVYSSISTTHAVNISDVTLSADSVSLTAIDTSSILGVAVGFGLATGQFAGLASTTISTISNTISAQIGDAVSAANTNVTSATGNIFVKASDTSNIRGAAGTIGINFGQAAVGLSIVDANIGNRVSATVDHATLSSGNDVLIQANSIATILTVSLGIAMSSNLSLAGSISTNTESTNVIAAVFAGDIMAHNNVGIASFNADTITVLAGAGAVVLAAGNAAGLSVVTNVIGGDTKSIIGAGSKVDALALGTNKVTVDSGDLNTPLDPSSANTATLDLPDLTESTRDVHGLAVVATSRQTIIANAVTAGLAFSILSDALAITPITNVTGGRTEASITNALIDTRAAGSGTQEIDVTGSSHTYSGNFIISLALGGFGGAGANSTNVLDRTTVASISGTNIGTSSKVGNITVKTNSTQAAADVVIGVAVGINSGAASAIVNKFDANTESFVTGGVINAAKLDVTANSTNGFYATAGVGAAAGVVGAAGAFIIAVTSNKTAAYVGDDTGGNLTTLNLSNEMTVSADSDNRFKSLAVGGAAAGGNGYAGMVNLIVASNETDANVYYVNLTQPNTGPAGVTVSANEDITIRPTTGAGGLAIFGVGAGAGANIVVLGSSVTAAITEGSSNFITSPGAIAVTATSNKFIDSQTVTAGAGLTAGVGAAVGIVLVGTSAPADAAGQINANGTGTLAQADIQTANQTITLSSAGIVAYRTALGLGGTDAQIQAAAQAEYSSLVQHGNLGTNVFNFSTDGLTLFAPKALNSDELTSYTQLVGEGVVTNGVLTLTTAGVAAYRTQQHLSSSVTDAQVRTQANAAYQVLVNKIGTYGYTRYQALAGDTVTFQISSAGISNYRGQATAGLNLACSGGATACATDTQVTQYANDQFQALTSTANGSLSNGVITLNATGLSAFRAAAQADANAKAAADAVASGTPAPNPPTVVLDSQVQAYANAQYQYLIGHQDNAIGSTPFSVSAGISKVNDGVTASIAGGTITASSVSTTATALNSTNNYATGVGVGAFGGVGAAVAYTRVATSISSTISQSTIHAGTVTINAVATDGATPAVKVEAHAGAGALGAAVGAAIADAQLDNTVTAALGGNAVLSGAASVSADDDSSVRADAFGSTVAGGAAIGVSSATATRTSTISSLLLSTSSVSATGLTVQATGEGSSYAGAVAGVGGIVSAGAAAASTATDSTSVLAQIGSGETINVGTGTINVLATDTPDAKAFTVGVTVAGGVSVGLSIATATVNPTITAELVGSTAPTDIVTAGNLNVKAKETVAGTLGTSIAEHAPASPTSTSDFDAGTTNAAAWSIAGTGAVFYSLAGASANANNNSGITARIGDYVTLPTANVVVEANGTTDQVASATGVSAGGIAALGVVISNAGATSTIEASLGNNVSMLANGTKALKVTAQGTDYNTANSVAGGGGLFAGSGAQASTSDNADVNVRLGNGVIVRVDSIVLSATHDDNFKTHVDSLQAAVVGASGSVAINNADSNVGVTLGNNDQLSANGSLTANCFTTLCPQAISITATNNFTQGSGDSVDAAAGGGINGAGGTSNTTLDGTAVIATGTGVSISSGSNPTSSPGTFSIIASSNVTTNDLVTLTTGGAIQGAGVDSTTHANVDNTVTIGNSNTLTSQGSIGIGTYTVANVANKAYVTTYGVAAVGAASATSDVVTNQSVTINAGSQIIAFSNVNIAAGQEPFGLYGTSIIVAPNAEGYVRGLIAIPVAVATDNISNNATLTIAGTSGGLQAAFIGAGQNAYLGAYTGAQDRSRTDATGHGYELGFIPVTNGHTNDGGSSSSTLNLAGSVTAGIYRNLGIIIGCGADGTTQCGALEVPKIFVNGQGGVTPIDGVSTLIVPSDAAPVGFTYLSALNPTNFINATFGQGSDAATALLTGLSAGNQKALFINTQLYASGGSVTINADTITGAGTVSAYGNAAISVVNNANVYLIIAGGALIPDIGGGNIIFTGAAAGRSGLHLVTDQPATTPGTPAVIPLPTITLSNTWGNSQGTVVSGPSLFVTGAVTNLGGSLSISNSYGSFGDSADMSSQQLTVYVPNGAFSVGGNNVNGFFAGGDPIGQWDSVLILPGRVAGGTDFNQVVMYLANAMFPTAGNTGTLNSDLYNFAGSPVQGGYQIANGQMCLFVGGTNCFGSGSSFTGDGLLLPTIAWTSLTKVSNNLNDAVLAGHAPNIYGAQVAIKANVINLNGNITAGQPTNWSLVLPNTAAFANLLAQDLSQYRSSGSANANPLYVLVDDKGVISSAAAAAGVAVSTVGDRAISVSYNAQTNQLVFGSVVASSGGGYVVLDGQIINTGAAGNVDANGAVQVINNIHLNAGFGQVTVVNNSGVAIVADSITTGNSAAAAAITSTVKIVDRNNQVSDAGSLKPQTTTYVYSPTTGVRKYLTLGGANPTDTTPYEQISGSSATFNPVAGSRYQWIEEAALTRTVSFSSTSCCVSSWVWDTSTPGTNQNSPWSYLTNPSPDQTASSDPSVLSSTPMGFIVKNVNDTSAFRETITGAIDGSTSFTQHFYGCGNDNVCNHGFRTNGEVETADNGHRGEKYAPWTFTFPTRAYLRVTASVKADYPVGISFSGNANAFVNIQSNASVLLNGNIANPSGTTTINASQGDITQASRVTQFLSGSMNLTASNGQIGTDTQAIAATLSQGATVTTQSKGNTNLSFDSNAAINSVVAGSAGTGYRDVVIAATGNITAAAANSAGISARNITLTSTTGSVGTIATPLAIAPHPDAPVNGVVNNGLVNITANGDIGINATPSAGNDLRVGSIISTSGDILINVASGSIVNARGQTAAQSLSADQVTAISSALHLTAGTGAAAAGAATVAAFEQKVTSDYAGYNALIQNGSYNATTGQFVLNPGADALYQAFATAAGMTVGAYVTSMYKGYTSDFTTAFGSNWASLSLFNGQYQTYQNLLNSGAVSAGGAFVLRGNSLSIYASAALDTNTTAFNALLANGTVSGTTLVLSGAGITSYTSAALSTGDASTLTALRAAGTSTVQNNILSLTSGGVASFASSALSGSDLTAFNNLMSDGTVTNGVLTLGVPGLAAYRTQASLSGQTDDMVQQMANAQYQTLSRQVQSYANSTYQTLVSQVQSYANNQYQGFAATIQTYANNQYTTNKATYTFSVSSPLAVANLAATLTANSTWTTGQLVSAIDRSALQPAATSVGNGTVNIAGRNVTITTATGSIGSLAPNVNIALTSATNANDNLTDGTLTQAELAALSVATTPGSVILNGRNASGQAVSGLSIGSVPAGTTLTSIDVTQLAPLYINVTGNLKVTSHAAAFLQTTTTGPSTSTSSAGSPANSSLPASGTTLHIDQVTALGAINIQAQQGILAALSSGGSLLHSTQISSTSGDLTLATGSGDLGSAANPLTYQIGGKLVSASSGGGSVYLDAIGSDIQIGRIFASNVASLTTATGSVTGYLAGIAISANSIVLNIAGDIGSSTTAFGLQVGSGFVISQSAIAGYRALAVACTQCVTDAQLISYATAQFQQLTLPANGTISGGVLTLNATGIAAFTAAAQATAQAAAPANTTAAPVTDADVQNYANSQYQYLNGHRDPNGLSGTIAGSGYIYSPQLTSPTAPALLISQLIAQNNLSVHADGLLELRTGLKATNGALSVLVGSLTMDSNSSMIAGGLINVSSLGSATIGQISTAYSSATNPPAAITVSAAGSIIGNGDNLTNLVASGTYGSVSLTAGTGIGTSAAPITFNAPFAKATALAGDINLSAVSSVEATLLSAEKGNVTIQGGGNLTLDSIVAGTVAGAVGGTVHATAAAGFLKVLTATSGGTQTLQAANDVTFTTLTANGITGDAGDVNVTSSAGAVVGDVADGSIAANGSVTLIAHTTNSGAALTAANGAIDLQAPGLINWTSLTAGTTISAVTTGGALTLGTARSGGTQTLQAANDVTFTTLTTDGISGGDAGDIAVTSSNGKVAGGSVAANGSATLISHTTNIGGSVTAATGHIDLQAPGLINWTSLTAGTAISAVTTGGALTLGTARSGGTQTLQAANDVTFTALTTDGISGGDAGNIGVTSNGGKIAGASVAANGSVTLTANDLIDVTTLNAGAAFGARSMTAGVTLGTATSGGSQTIRAAQDVNFNRLAANGTAGDVGDVTVTADAGLIQGVTLNANGSAVLTAATTNKGTTLTAATGSATLRATGLIDWATLDNGTFINVRSTGANVNIGTATSGGSQTIRAAQDVNFNRLATNGTAGDVGDVTVTADAGLIQGVTLNANGSAVLTAATTNKGTTLTTATGSATLLAGGLIDWANINTAKAFTAISTGGAINIGTATSGGTQTLHAKNDIVFTRLTTTGVPGDQGDISVLSDQGSIHGVTVSANGDASFDSGVSVDLGTLKGGSVALSTPHDLTINFLQVLRGITLAADTINVTAEQLPSNPPVPLHVTVTGYRGGVATMANLVIDPPEVIIDKLMVTDTVINIDSPKLTIADGYVPGSMMLTTPAGDILLDNRAPAPTAGVNLQLYQPSGFFSMQQFGNANFTNTYVVYYDTTISSTITNYGGGPFSGSSFVRNIPRDMKNGDGFDFASVDKSGLATFYLLGLPGGWRIDAARIPLPVEAIGEGPAVNIDGLPEAKKLHQTRDRKTVRNRIRSTSLEQRGGVRFDFASAAR